MNPRAEKCSDTLVNTTYAIAMLFILAEKGHTRSTSSCICLAWLPSWLTMFFPVLVTNTMRGTEPRSRCSRGKTRYLRERNGRARGKKTGTEHRQKPEISLEIYQELFPPLYTPGVINTCFPSRGACTLLKLRYERKRRDKYELHAAKSHNGA